MEKPSVQDLQSRFLNYLKSRDVLENLLNTFQGVVVVLDPDFHIIFFNRAAEEVTGYTQAKVQGMNLAELFLPFEEKQAVKNIFENLRNHRAPNRYRNPWLTRWGEYRYFEWSNTVIQDESGNVAFIIGMGMDVTDKEEILRANQTMRARFERVFRANPMGLALVSGESLTISDCNERFASMLEIPRSQLIGKDLVSLGILETPYRFQEIVYRHARFGNSMTEERPSKTASGSTFHGRISLEPMDLMEEPTLVLTLQDITTYVQIESRLKQVSADLERKIKESSQAYETVRRELQTEVGRRRALELSSRRLLDIIWEAGEAIAIMDSKGWVVYLNKSARALLGMDEYTPIAQHQSMLYEKYKNFPVVVEQVIPALLQEGMWRGEMEWNSGSSEVLYLSVTILAHRDEQGKVQNFSLIAHDITEEKRVTEAIKREFQREKEDATLRSYLFSATSHQFRTPLSTILSSTELLETYGQKWGWEKSLQHLQRIKTAAQQMNTLLGDILKVLRLEAEQDPLHIQPVDVRKLLRECAEVVKNALDPNRKIFLECEADHPVLSTDPDLLWQVLENLLTNAIKYSPSDTWIYAYIRSADSGIQIEIRDEGMGVPQDELPLLFEPFYRASNTSGISGSGLGLMIVRKALERLRGTIDFSSELHHGSVVTVTLTDLSHFQEAKGEPGN
ncbi:PAS domain S-box protein [Anaerolinea sp.]|uniref:PAS domain-containing sensor histidine kinase n=1 Tax=Anaerolinea sp. TaxID=1872519 RepID=UPI0026126E7E|nr:PAS domain S-box protein [uncultured Anaerolinea sp.]